MLQLQANVNPRVLLSYGFIYDNSQKNYIKYLGSDENEIVINEDSRELLILFNSSDDFYDIELLADLLFDLIKNNLIKKIA